MLDRTWNMLGGSTCAHVSDRESREMRPLQCTRCTLYIFGLLNNTVNTVIMHLDVIHCPVLYLKHMVFQKLN
jgi:hypothetical protein